MNKRNIIIAVVFILAVAIFFLIPKKDHTRSGGVTVVKKSSSSETQPSNQEVQKLYEEATTLKQDGEFLKAKGLYKTIVMDYPYFENIQAAQQELESLNMHILFSNLETDSTVLHEVVSGDTLGELAKKYGTTIELIKRSNNLNNNIIRIGQRLRIWQDAFNIYVDKSQNVLLLKKDDEVIKVYDVSTGSNSSTPVGTYTITSRLMDPVWFNKGVVLPPESPQNVLGTRWLGFNLPGYGIHGTIEPETIGQQVTAGCVRMRNEEVEELYSIIPIGTEVVIVN